VRAFYVLIDRMNAAEPDERPRIEQMIRENFEVEKAVFALDMSGFSLTVRRDGILAYLGLNRRMQLITGPCVARFGGEVVKFEADNLFALFDRPDDAVRAALAINRALRDEPRDRAIRVAIGIDFGRLLSVPGSDCFGDPVNIASKLGEDLAEADEVLLTRAASERLTPELLAEVDLEEITLSIAGIEIHTSRVRDRLWSEGGPNQPGSRPCA
jgi:class 3 adenylate cyclase